VPDPSVRTTLSENTSITLSCVPYLLSLMIFEILPLLSYWYWQEDSLPTKVVVSPVGVQSILLGFVDGPELPPFLQAKKPITNNSSINSALFMVNLFAIKITCYKKILLSHL
jgi:hypothetical protein